MTAVEVRRSTSSFNWYWASVAVSSTGSAVSAVVIPIIAVTTLHASVGQISVLTALGLIPSLLLQVLVSAWADATASRVRAMILTDVASAALIALVPVLWWLHALTFVALVLVMGVMSLVGVVRLACTAPVITEIVPQDGLVTANGKIQGTQSAADVIGKSAAGGLLAAFTPPLAVLVDAMSYLLSALLGTRISTRAEPRPAAPGGDAPPRRSIGDVARVLVRRLDLWCVMPIALSNGITETVYMILLIRTLGVRPSVVAALLSLGAIGGIAGGFIAGKVASRFGNGGVLAGIVLAAWSLLPLTFVGRGIPAILAIINLELSGALGGTIVIASVFGNIQGAAASDSVSRTMAIANNALQAAALVGIFLGGVIGDLVNARAALIVAFLLLPAMAAPLYISYLRSGR